MSWVIIGGLVWWLVVVPVGMAVMFGLVGDWEREESEEGWGDGEGGKRF